MVFTWVGEWWQPFGACSHVRPNAYLSRRLRVLGLPTADCRLPISISTDKGMLAIDETAGTLRLLEVEELA